MRPEKNNGWEGLSAPFFFLALFSIIISCAEQDIWVARIINEKEICSTFLCSNHGVCRSKNTSQGPVASCLCEEGYVADNTSCRAIQSCEKGTVNIEGRCLPEGALTDLCPDNDRQIDAMISELAPNASLTLPTKGGPDEIGWNTQMHWRNLNCSALYAGSYTGVPAKISQEVWSYHLGKNQWELLFEGNKDLEQYKAAVDLFRRTLDSPDQNFTTEEEAKLSDFRRWWRDNIVFRDGHLTMQNGGPILPRMVYDGMTYNASFRALIWGSGASLDSILLDQIHAWATGLSPQEIEDKKDNSYARLWAFSPKSKTWRQLKTSSKLRPTMKPISASLLSTREELHFFGSRDPFEMWTFNLNNGVWKEDDFDQPGQVEQGEVVSVVGVQAVQISDEAIVYINDRAMIFNESTKIWTPLPPPPTPASSSHTLLMFDPVKNKVLLFSPRVLPFLSILDLSTRTWSTEIPAGPPIADKPFGSYFGYFDSAFGVAVIHAGKDLPVWIYRPK